MFNRAMADEPTIAPTAAAQPRRVVVVLGMHRSGTSAVAGCLHRLGIDFGPRLMPATPDNPRGYYEHIDLVNLHDRLLLALGRSWDDTFPFPAPGWEDEAGISRFRAEALELLRRDFAEADCPWGFKDPRLCRLISWWEPLWRAINSRPLFVLLRRSPAEVAASLKRREGFSAAKCHLLWLQHTLEAERGTRGRERVLIDFGTFIGDWRRTVGPIVEALRLPAPAALPDESPAREFVDPAVLRSQVESGASAHLPTWVREADDALLAGIAGHEETMRLRLDSVVADLAAAESLYAPAERAAADDFRLQIEAVRKQAAWYEEEWHKARGRVADLADRLAAKRIEIQNLKSRRTQK